MQLTFIYPDDPMKLEIILATKAYEAMWRQDSQRIQQVFEKYTGLQFQQDNIDVVVHEEQSWSGMDGKPMRLNVANQDRVKKQNALIHELAHRLLFGNGISTPIDDETDEEEFRVYLFQGDVLREVYGDDAYNYWSSTDPEVISEQHISIVKQVLALSNEERQKKLRQIIKQAS